LCGILSVLKKDYQIALVSSGISHVQRGFETFIVDLALALDSYRNVHLFQGSGPARSQKATILPTLRRNSWAMQWLGPKLEHKRYRLEQLSFILSGWILGHWPKYDLIYYCDTDIGDALYQLRRKFGYKYRLLYGNCAPTSPGYREKRYDHIQQFSSIILEQALTEEIPISKMTLLPMGINVVNFEAKLSKPTLREKYNIPNNKFVLLTVSSIDDRFKRLQWLIKTISEMHDSNVYVLLVGQNEKTPYARETLDLAHCCLPGRYQHLTIPHSEIVQIYKASDIFIHPALQEGFGKVYLEAAACQIPILCHDSAHTRWLIAHNFSRLNMENKAALQEHIRQIQASSLLQEQIIQQNYFHIINNFEWKNLKNQYLEMFNIALS
jgi:glycosyltransferase involved in cell wall biosynthesis